MYKRVKTKDGLIVCQAENNHITIRDHGSLVAHIPCTVDKSIEEMLKMYHDLVDSFGEGE